MCLEFGWTVEFPQGNKKDLWRERCNMDFVMHHTTTQGCYSSLLYQAQCPCPFLPEADFQERGRLGKPSKSSFGTEKF